MFFTFQLEPLSRVTRDILLNLGSGWLALLIAFPLIREAVQAMYYGIMALLAFYLAYTLDKDLHDD